MFWILHYYCYLGAAVSRTICGKRNERYYEFVDEIFYDVVLKWKLVIAMETILICGGYAETADANFSEDALEKVS